MRILDIIGRKGPLVHSVSAYAPLSIAISVMNHHNIGSAVVQNPLTQLPCGIVSQTEILACLDRVGAGALSLDVGKVMRAPMPSCDPELGIGAAMIRMTRDRTRHLLVMAGESEVLGIVSIGDLVAARLDAMTLETAVLRDLALPQLMMRAA